MVVGEANDILLAVRRGGHKKRKRKISIHLTPSFICLCQIHKIVSIWCPFYYILEVS